VGESQKVVVCPGMVWLVVGRTVANAAIRDGSLGTSAAHSPVASASVEWRPVGRGRRSPREDGSGHRGGVRVGRAVHWVYSQGGGGGGEYGRARMTWGFCSRG
jgi:hypothetical protein